MSVGYKLCKLCKGCGQPMLKNGQKRKHPDDYRHAQGCPLASEYEWDLVCPTCHGEGEGCRDGFHEVRR